MPAGVAIAPDHEDHWRAELERLRHVGDAGIDPLIAAYRERHPDITDLRALVRSVIADLAAVKAGDHDLDSVRRRFGFAPPLPEWAGDKPRLQLGQEMFNEYGLEMSGALCFFALPVAYAADQGATALSRVSDLATKNASRRIAETGQMLIDVMGTRGPDSLEPGSRGYATAIGLRLLHGCVRSMLSDPASGADWPATLDPPVNQEIQLATLMDFTAMTWWGLHRFGVDLSDAEREAHLYTWSIVGHLMGLEACADDALTLDDADVLPGLFARHLGDTPGGRVLTTALLTTFESFMPLGWRKLPRSVIQWIAVGAPYGYDAVPRLLGVPPPAWWSRPFFGLWLAARRSRLLAPLRWPLNWAMRRGGRLVIIGFADHFAPDAPPFEVPDHLAHSWKIPKGRARRRMRGVRRRARHQVRRAMPRPKTATA